MSIQAHEKVVGGAAGCPPASPFAAVTAPLDDADMSDEETLQEGNFKVSGHREVSNCIPCGAALPEASAAQRSDGAGLPSAAAHKPAIRAKATTYRGNGGAGANRRRAAERPARQKKRETVLELQDRLKKAQRRNAALSSTLDAEEAQREALQTRLKELKEKCSRAQADTQRIAAAYEWRSARKRMDTGSTGGDGGSTSQGIVKEAGAAGGAANIYASADPGVASAWRHGAPIRELSPLEQPWSLAQSGATISTDAGVHWRAAAAAHADTRDFVGSRTHTGEIRSRKEAVSAKPAVVLWPQESHCRVVTPLHSAIKQQEEHNWSALAPGGEPSQQQQHRRYGEPMSGGLGPRGHGSGFLCGDALDELFLREMSLLEPLPSFTADP